MKKLLTILLAALTLLIISPKLALAANLNVECPKSPSGCSITGDNPLFSKALDGEWYPGRELTKTINLKNVSSQIRQMGIKGAEISLSNDLKQVMSVSFIDDANTVIWFGTLSDFYNQGGIVMGTFNPGVNKDYYFKITMDSAADNDYQSLETKFDLTFGFWGDVISTPSNQGGPGDGLSDGKSDGKSSQAPVPSVLGVAVSTINEFIDDILGDEAKTKEITPIPTRNGIKDVLGKQTSEYCSFCLWWPIILGEIISLVIYYYLTLNKKLNKKYLKRTFAWSLAIPIIAYIIFILINKDCFGHGLFWFIIESENLFCKYFWMIDLTVYVVLSYGWKRYFAKRKS